MANEFSLSQELIKSALTLTVSFASLGLGWLVGQGLTYKWSVKQKRSEQQLTVSRNFYVAYGESFAVWKWWNRIEPDSPNIQDRTW